MNEILKKIEEANHIVVISHINPDADSIGSASAVYTHLLRLHKKVSFFCVTKNINQKLSFIPWFDKIKDSFPKSADLAICLDCANKDRIGIDIECDTINIDHHKSNTNYADINLVDASSISTTKVLYDFFKTNDIKINPKMATALYAGALDDSDGFLDDMVDGTTFAFVKELIDNGANYKECNKYIKKYLTLAAFRLKAIMYQKMSLHCDARVAVFLVDEDDMKASGAMKEDCENALEEALYLPSVEVSVLIKLNQNLSIKGSLRSCSNLDVSKIATYYGGGGHNARAGFTIASGMMQEEVKNQILKLIIKEI